MKDIIKKEKGEHPVSHGFNYEAFEFIFRKMLDMIKIKNCWLILKFFGYNLDLTLSITEKESSLTDLKTYYTILPS